MTQESAAHTDRSSIDEGRPSKHDQFVASSAPRDVEQRTLPQDDNRAVFGCATLQRPWRRAVQSMSKFVPLLAIRSSANVVTS